MSEKVTNSYLIEHCRYKIWCDYYGVYDQKRVIAFADNIDDCKFIISALEKCYAGRTFSFEAELIADFDELKDVAAADLFKGW